MDRIELALALAALAIAALRLAPARRITPGRARTLERAAIAAVAALIVLYLIARARG